MQNFIRGLLIPFEAARIILANRILLLYSIIPVIISILVYLTFRIYVFVPIRTWAMEGVALGFRYVPWIGGAGIIETVISALVGIALEIGFWVFGALIFSAVTNLIGIPFYDLLSSRSETRVIPALVPVADQTWGKELSNFYIDFKKSILSIGLIALCFLLGLIPVLNIFALLCGWLLLTYQFVSYPQTRRGIGARAGLKWIRQHLFMSLGFGLVIGMGFAIPFFSVLVAPVAVVGGTLLYSKVQGDGQLQMQS